MTIKKVLPGIALFAVGVLLVVVLFSKIDFKEFIALLSNFPVKGFILVLTLSILASLIANWRAYIILKSFGVKMTFFQVWGVWLSGNAFNYLTPLVYLGGEGVKAYILHEEYGVELNKAVSFMILDRIFEISASLFVIIVGLVTFTMYSGLGGVTKTITTVIAFVAIAAFIFFVFYLQVFRGKKIITPVLKFLSAEKTRVGKFLRKSENEIMKFFSGDREILWKGWLISMLKQSVHLLRHISILYFLGRGLKFVEPIVSLSALYAGFAVPIPAALGVQETFQSVVFSALNFATEDGLVLSIVLRGVDILLIGAGLAILLRYGLDLVRTATLYMLKLSNGNGIGKHKR